MSLEYVYDAIEKGIYASHLDKVNDPYESEGIVNTDKYRVCCMTNSPRKILLWSYYLRHEGCVIAIDVTTIKKSDSKAIRYVTYDDKLRHIRREMSPTEIVEDLYHKGKEWEHENEYRAVYYEQSAKKETWNIYKNEVYLNARVTEVIFGLKVNTGYTGYLELLAKIKEYNESHVDQIAVKKLILKSNKYELCEDRQYDYKEILKCR